MFGRIMSKLGYVKKAAARNFKAADTGRLVASWNPTNISSDGILRYQLSKLRARSRDLSINNPYMKKFVDMVLINVLGATGINFQSKIKLADGSFDELKNREIEARWAFWGKRRNMPDVTGLLSWSGIQRLVLRSVVVDGEVFIRKIRGFGNDCGYALQILEADYVDETYNVDLADGRKIRLGIEFDVWGKPIAYHVSKQHPGDLMYAAGSYGKSERIPAEDMIHLYIPLRPGQKRGIPWGYAVMIKTNIFDGLEEAELVASRIGAATMGFFTTNNPNGALPGDYKDSSGVEFMTAEPGTFRKAPEGTTLTMFDPKHPAGNYAPFAKVTLRAIACGCNVSYHSMANDLEGVNFSSIRSGTLEERDNWKSIQGWFSDDLCDMVQHDWLKMQLLTQGLPYPLRDFEKLHQSKWQGRSWAWVDPLKDIKASVEAKDNGLVTRTELAAERGLDFYELVDAIAAENEYLRSKGLDYLVTEPPKIKNENTDGGKTDE